MSMDTLGFLKRVLPAEGFYCATVINDNSAPQQAFFDSVEELATNCRRYDQAGNNTYYATSTFNTRFNRTQVNSKLVKTLFIDIDCGPDKVDQVDKNGDPIPDKGYLSQALGLQALLDFINVTKLPWPMIVSSGRGLHVYWVLSEALPKNEWQPLANALKATFKVNKFLFDPAVTADSARVLRPIGTHNPKNGKEVKLLRDAPDYDKQTLQNILGSATPMLVTDSGINVPSMVLPTSALSAALEIKQDFEPSNPDTIYNSCQQVRWGVDNQDKVSEPMWYSLIGIAAHCQNPEETAKNWSMNHPDYNEASTLNKLRQWQARTTGPATCKKLEDDKPKGCDKCPLKGNITSPAMCGRVYKETKMAADAPDDIAHKISPPKPFKVSGDIIVQSIDGTEVEISPFLIYPVGYGRDDSLGYETVRFKWKRPHEGWQDLVFRQAHLNSKSREFPTVIADQGIVLKTEKQTQGFQYMLRGYMDELRKTQSMSNIHGVMGWKDNFSQFVIGERLYKRGDDGAVTVEDISLSSAASNMGSKMYSMAGSADTWTNATNVLQTANLPHHIFALNNSLAAPLWAFTGLKGVTVSLFGPSGSGKSIAQLFMQSVWGNPDKLHFAAKFTHNALFNRLGTYCNLPMTIDEATMMEDVGSFCYWVTQGRDKARLTRTASERDAKEWATSVTVSTNISFASKMAASGIETSAQMARLLEIEMPTHKLFRGTSDAGRKFSEFLSDNHGVIGDLLMKEYLRLGKTELKRRIAEATLKFADLYGFRFAGVERFWEAALVLQHVACTIATEIGVISYDFTIGIRLVVDQIEGLRTKADESRITGFDIIKEYLNETAADILTVMHTTSGNVPATHDINREPRGEIKARFDVYRSGPMDKFDRGTVMLVRKKFKEYVASRGYDYNALCREVGEVGADATPHTKKVSISKDTNLKAGQHYVLGINLNNMEMVGFLDIAQQGAENMTLGQLGVIT
jgi:hypothetical protein|tara:strand:- start:3826 stop:6738 length:2913 start_codon:yes stop_codon:yes gene_type:complete